MRGSSAALAAAWAVRKACCVPLVMPLNFTASSCGVECEEFSQLSSSVPAGGAGEEDLAVDGFEGVVALEAETEVEDGGREGEDELGAGDDVLLSDVADCDVSDTVGLSAVRAAAVFSVVSPAVRCEPWVAIAVAVPA